ncbi:MAG: antibiotic biosynthesis monooxygenase [Bifidobacteriaceae bacterium]|jgi:quinol monooxygenase YgiN|nr:antibiotic biosynthesis monooxygenase [Bifidobacteriaceae bacterium]
MANAVVVVATFFPGDGMRDSVHAVIKAAQTDVYQEPGCLLYSLHEAPDRFVLIEKWDSAESLKAHGEGKALKRLTKDLSPLLAQDAEVIYLEPVGDASAHPAATVKGADAPELPAAPPPVTAKEAAQIIEAGGRPAELIEPGL